MEVAAEKAAVAEEERRRRSRARRSEAKQKEAAAENPQPEQSEAKPSRPSPVEMAGWDEYVFEPREGESFLEAYVRFSELKLRRRQNRDRILMGVLHASGDCATSPNTRQLHTARALTEYKTKHVARMLELHRTHRAGAVVQAVSVIQAAWRRYRTRRQLLGSQHSRLSPSRRPSQQPKTRSASLSPPRTYTRPSFHFDDVVDATMVKTRTTPSPPRGNPKPRGRRNIGAKTTVLPALQRPRPPQRLRAATIQAPLTPRQRMIYELRSHAAASRVRARKGWNDDPHFDPPAPDRFASCFYPPRHSGTKNLPQLRMPTPPRPKKEWVV